ncbi:MAG: hypothetical protein JWR51_438 [Devosia sp.]|nr:hypothetical protein [Devosia sp.]
MPTNHAPAILKWREDVDRLEGGLSDSLRSSTVSTMLFGCNQWIRTHAKSASPEEVARIEDIRSELELWLAERGLTFSG